MHGNSGLIASDLVHATILCEFPFPSPPPLQNPAEQPHSSSDPSVMMTLLVFDQSLARGKNISQRSRNAHAEICGAFQLFYQVA